MKRIRNSVAGGLSFLVGTLPSCRQTPSIDMNHLSEQERVFAESFDPARYSKDELDYMARIRGVDLQGGTGRDAVAIYRAVMRNFYDKIDMNNLTESDRIYLADFDLNKWNAADREFFEGFNYLFDSKNLSDKDKVFLGRVADFYVGEMVNLPRD